MHEDNSEPTVSDLSERAKRAIEESRALVAEYQSVVARASKAAAEIRVERESRWAD